jgi:hypothetical protein
MCVQFRKLEAAMFHQAPASYLGASPDPDFAGFLLDVHLLIK